jgi:hypothetical protein
MNIESKIAQVNNILRVDYAKHNYNRLWISENFPHPILGNKYEYLRNDAPFYCNSSLGVMLNYYQNKNDFKSFIEQTSNQLLKTDFKNESLNVILNWIISHTKRPIINEGSDKLDLQNVGWWMGQAVYIACIVSDTYNAQYEKLFFEAWNRYFTNEQIDNY